MSKTFHSTVCLRVIHVTEWNCNLLVVKLYEIPLYEYTKLWLFFLTTWVVSSLELLQPRVQWIFYIYPSVLPHLICRWADQLHHENPFCSAIAPIHMSTIRVLVSPLPTLTLILLAIAFAIWMSVHWYLLVV
jgi:hypothetical protein